MTLGLLGHEIQWNGLRRQALESDRRSSDSTSCLPGRVVFVPSLNNRECRFLVHVLGTQRLSTQPGSVPLSSEGDGP